MQRPEQRRQLQLQLGQPPPDLWINAKTMAPTRQQGFSQIARGAPVRQGAWAAPPPPQIPAALKLGLACLPGSVPGEPRRPTLASVFQLQQWSAIAGDLDWLAFIGSRFQDEWNSATPVPCTRL